ncbi:MAG: Linoleoyl-CoA desaturase, partial [uncultured Propionibacteriaceae bacterium]
GRLLRAEPQGHATDRGAVPDQLRQRQVLTSRNIRSNPVVDWM